MSDLDRRLREALRERFGSDEFDDTRDQNILDMTISVFQSRSRFLSVVVMVVMTALVVIAILATIRFFQVTEVRHQIMYSVVFMYCALGVAMLKLWFWMEMNRNSVMRELKRIELLIARIASERENGGS